MICFAAHIVNLTQQSISPLDYSSIGGGYIMPTYWLKDGGGKHPLHFTPLVLGAPPL